MRSIVPCLLAVLLCTASVSAQSKPTPGRPTTPAAAPQQKPDTKGFRFSFSTSRGRLGTEVSSMTEELRAFFGAPKDSGVLVQRVEAGGPAAKAGVRVGDVITRVDGQPVESSADVTFAVSKKKSGERVTIGVVRAKRFVQLNAKLDSDPLDTADFELDFDLDDPMSLFRQLAPSGRRSWFKSWSWQWPPPQGGGSAPKSPTP